jgi:hypothetical protein
MGSGRSLPQAELTMQLRPRRAAWVGLAVMLATASAALAKPKQDARPHIERATKAHHAGKFDESLVELQAAYAIDPQPDLLFAIGQVYTKLGRCSEANDAYKRYLATGASPKAAQVVQQAIEACKPRAATEPAPVPPTGTEPTPPPTAGAARSPSSPSPTPRPVSGHSPWYRDVVGDVLLVGGVASLTVGVLVYRGAVTDLDSAERAPTHDRYVDLVDGARSKRLVSVALIGGGVALAGAGVLRFVLHGRRSSSETRRVTLAPAPGGGFITWAGSF